MDNVLVFRSDFSRVKLCDFGESRKSGTIVQRRNEWLPYSPPEVLSIRTDDTYKTDPSHDVWQFGIVAFVCLTGCLPWQKAAQDDPRYVRYTSWHGSSLTFPLKRQPKLFKLISNRACKLFRKYLEPKSDRRPKNFTDLQKFLDDRWLAKGAEKDLIAVEPDELCPSMYSFHSSVEEKNKLLYTLAEAGIETTVDRVAKKNRIRDWIQSSVIMEEDEENDSGRTTPSSTVSRTPVVGHVSSVRAAEQNEKKENKIKTTIKDANSKHIDPRTGIIQQGPSEMGGTANQQTLAEKNLARREAVSSGGTRPVNNNYVSSQMSQMSEVGTMVNGRLEISSNNVNIQAQNQAYHKHRNGQFSSSFNNKQNTENSGQSRTNLTSKGLLSAYHSVATITLPSAEIQQDTRAVDSPIKDSGYGSLDLLRHDSMKSPVLSKRSPMRSDSGSLNVNNSNNSKESSPFSSNGFFNSSSYRMESMKDSPYDVQPSLKKK